jgi:two-component system chemotaxis response regulator CheB
MSSVEDGKPLRFRCQVGHAFTARGLAQAHTEETEAALGIALRVLEERRKLVERLAQEAREAGRSELAALYEPRMAEYGHHAEVIRNVLLKVLDSDDREAGEEGEAAVGD